MSFWSAFSQILLTGCLELRCQFWSLFPTHLKLKVGNKISLSVPTVMTAVSLSKFLGEGFYFKIKVAKFYFSGFVGKCLSVTSSEEGWWRYVATCRFISLYHLSLGHWDLLDLVTLHAKCFYF